MHGLSSLRVVLTRCVYVRVELSISGVRFVLCIVQLACVYYMETVASTKNVQQLA
jgi:hypothetical protein